jgi:Fic family protein
MKMDQKVQKRPLQLDHAMDVKMTWPPTSYEQQMWEPDEEEDSFGNPHERGTYYANVPPKLAFVEFAIPSSLGTIITRASQLISTFDNEHGEILAPFTAMLLRSEAAASSEIENLSASPRSILQAEIGINTGGNAEQIAANTEAMKLAIESTKDLSLHSILEMHRLLMSRQHSVPAGAMRDVPVWIGGRSPVSAAMVGMDSHKLDAAMNDLLLFIQREDVPSLIKAALAHAHFENIHPFEDGNGRTGRALVHSILRKEGLCINSVVPISAGLLTSPQRYYRALDLYREGNAGPIVALFAESATIAVNNGRKLSSDIREITENWNIKLRAVRSHSSVWKLLTYLSGTPVLTIRSCLKNVDMSQTALYDSLNLLESEGIISKSGNREKTQWRSVELLDALDRFAIRAGRRAKL